MRTEESAEQLIGFYIRSLAPSLPLEMDLQVFVRASEGLVQRAPLGDSAAQQEGRAGPCMEGWAVWWTGEHMLLGLPGLHTQRVFCSISSLPQLLQKTGHFSSLREAGICATAHKSSIVHFDAWVPPDLSEGGSLWGLGTRAVGPNGTTLWEGLRLWRGGVYGMCGFSLGSQAGGLPW